MFSPDIVSHRDLLDVERDYCLHGLSKLGVTFDVVEELVATVDAVLSLKNASIGTLVDSISSSELLAYNECVSIVSFFHASSDVVILGFADHSTP